MTSSLTSEKYTFFKEETLQLSRKSISSVRSVILAFFENSLPTENAEQLTSKVMEKPKVD